MCEWTDHVGLHHTKTDAEDEANGDVVPQPLYRSPPQPRGWLTEEERRLIESLEGTFQQNADALRSQGLHGHVDNWERKVKLFRSILARSSPPEVVKPQGLGGPKLDQETTIQRRDRQWIKALAAIGVAVKEVG
jgi:hypothetical protein